MNIVNALKKLFKGKRRTISYYHIDDYQIDMIIKDKFIYLLGIMNILTFLSPNEAKEKEIIEKLEKLYKKKIIKSKRMKTYTLNDLITLIKMKE
ncbi:MAG: hypothetical protein ACYDD5_00305 [Sulfuricurvum sp.]